MIYEADTVATELREYRYVAGILQLYLSYNWTIRRMHDFLWADQGGMKWHTRRT